MTMSTTVVTGESSQSSCNKAPPSSSSDSPQSSPAECTGCGKKIRDRYMLKALNLLWHEDCLKCGCCECRLGEVGSTLYTKGNLILCKRDYLRLFGATGFCSVCNKMIPAFEMVMRAKGNVYHLECFACQQCNHRFCVGDRFFLSDNKILCEYDYEERMVFANMSCNSNPNMIGGQYKHLQQSSATPNCQGSKQQQNTMQCSPTSSMVRYSLPPPVSTPTPNGDGVIQPSYPSPTCQGPLNMINDQYNRSLLTSTGQRRGVHMASGNSQSLSNSGSPMQVSS